MRIKISVQLLQRSVSKKLLVFQDRGWVKVKDLEDHIKSLFNLGDLQLELFVDGFWVPGSEKIGVIKSTDVVIVKEAPVTSTTSPSNNMTPAADDSERSSTTVEGIVDEDDLSSKKLEVLSKIQPKEDEDDLSSKKLEVLSKIQPKEDEDDLSSKKLEALSKIQPPEDEEMDVADFGDVPLKKRKRKRKHKKPPKMRLLAGITADLPQTAPSAPAPAKRTEAVILRPGHIRFGNEEENEIAVPESRPEEKQEDWHQILLSLAQERNKVVFNRQIAIDGVNGMSHQETDTVKSRSQIKANGSKPSVGVPVDQATPADNVDDHYVSTVSLPMESPRTSDLMYFKKLMMMGSIPTVSNFMLAVVEEIEEEHMLTLKICVGHTDESFSAEELQESEGDSFIVKVPWSAILEPRLVTDQQLLSEYL